MTAVATLHVLIVEDEPIFAATVRRYLEWKGHSVAVARDAGEALRQHRAHPADVALIDLALPGTDGLTVLRQLREDPKAPECLIVTGRGTFDAAVEATRLGAADFVGKPCDFADVDARIERALQRRAAGLSPLPQAPLSLDEVERRHIGNVLQKAGWHQGRAARLLGISAKTLYRKIREYGFQRPRHGPDA